MQLLKAILPLFFLQTLFGDIFEIKYISEIDKYIKDNTLIIFDLDNTVMEPVQEMGNDQWFHHRMTLHKKGGLSQDEAFQKALFEWTGVRYLTDMKLVEPHTASLIRDLQNKGKTLFALSTQSHGLAHRTTHQLHSLGVHFEKSPPSKEEFVFENEGICHYRLGILFTSGTDKGNALQKFLEQIQSKPSHIVFINDKLDHLHPIDAFCRKAKIPFVGLRYGFLDEKVKNFRGDIADLQFAGLERVLADKESKR